MFLKRLFRIFVEGTLVFVPFVITVYVIYSVFQALDRFFGFSTPGIGFLLTLGIIFVLGLLSSFFFTQRVIQWFESLVVKLPIIKVLYVAVKDVLKAVMGQQKGFDKPVLVEIMEGSNFFCVGFLTSEEVTQFGLTGYVAVYFPQSYNIAGNLVLMPAHRVQFLNIEPKAAISFTISGGISLGDSLKKLDQREP